MEATTPTTKSKRRLRRKRRELDALVVGVAANGRISRRGNRTSSSSDSSSCGGDDPEAGLCPPRASSSSSGGGCRRREEARRRCGRRHSRCTGGRGPKGTGRRCLSSRPRGAFPLAVRGAGACMAVACLLGAATALAWLFLDARHQTDSLRVHLDAVVAGSKGVPDALQKCHSMSKELQHNQTLLLKQLMSLTSQVTNFSLQVKEVHHGLSEVEGRIKGSPELVSVPQEIAELTDSVGHLGSSVGGLEASVTSLKSSSQVLQNESNTLKEEVLHLKEAVLQLSNVSMQAGNGNGEDKTATSKKEEDLENLVASIKKELADLSANVSRLNDTIVKKLNMNDKELSEQQKLFDVLANVSSRVITLEGTCGSLKEQNELSNELQNISLQTNEAIKRIYNAEVQLDLISKTLKDQIHPLSRKNNAEESSTASPVISTSFIKEPVANPVITGTSSQPSHPENPTSTTVAPQNISIVNGPPGGVINSEGLSEATKNNTNI